jgi:hypothetical protein
MSLIDKRVARTTELSTFFTSEAGKEFQPYQESINKVAMDPRFIGLKMDRIVGLALTPAVLMRIGAKMSKEADDKARGNNTGGNSNSTTANAQPKNFWTMSQEEFAAHQQSVLQGTNK